MGRGALTAAGALLASLSLLLAAPGPAAATIPFASNGMWIWYVSQSSGGHPSRIAHRARTHGISTIYIKSSDGPNAWSQFDPTLVSYLQSRGLDVCAWQFIYGDQPGLEARRGAEAVGNGADCLVIDAESTYEGRYAQASRYVHRLRALLPHPVPIALASFPYVDYHPAFPYSVFLGEGGATFNIPQIYWHTIGTTVAEADSHTWRWNRVYGRPIFPLGQTFDDPPLRQLRRFRRYANSYGWGGLSWWDWQETTARQWRALARPVKRGIPGFDRPTADFPVLTAGSRGDVVVSAQERLRRAHLDVPISGYYGPQTTHAVKRFQKTHGIAVDGMLDAKTWRALLSYRPIPVNWSNRGSPKAGTASAPRSAGLPAVRDEIPPAAAR